jgi:hypothetical protein
MSDPFDPDNFGPEEITIDGIKLAMTCPACPEQYDALGPDGVQVGYLRLRHGEFRVDHPCCGVETIFYSEEATGDGAFEPSERMQFLEQAVTAIKRRLERR